MCVWLMGGLGGLAPADVFELTRERRNETPRELRENVFLGTLERGEMWREKNRCIMSRISWKEGDGLDRLKRL